MNIEKTMLAAVVAVAIAGTAACSRQEATQATDRAQQTATNVKEKVSDAVRVAVPIGDRDDPAARERERFDEQWRNLESLRNAKPAAPQGAAGRQVNVQFAPGGSESFGNFDPNAINNAPVVVPLKGDVSGPSVLKTQVYLDRANFSVGVMDGRWGRNTAIALWWFQRTRGIDANEPGALDEATFRALASASDGAPALVRYTVTAEDLKGPFVDIPEDVYDKEKLDCLCYESAQEKLAEKFHTTREFLGKLNPNVDFQALSAGAQLWVPNVRPPNQKKGADIARIEISIKGNTFNAFDANGNLVFHGPTTLGSKYDPSPNETLKVNSITPDPWFHYQPTLFHEVPDEEPEANLAPGPNSPVGVVWIELSKPHYGIHGTSDPESIGYASSHGCVRLTNWDAREVGQRVSPGVTVEFQDTRKSDVSNAASR